MNLKMQAHLLGLILIILAVLMLFPTAVGLIYHENVLCFLIPVAGAALVGLPLALYRPKDQRIFTRDGYVCVALGWLLLSLVGAVPFVLGGAIPNYVDALFETASGFTTTGASILPEVESLPKGILFWRSFTHWVGGMGVLVFILAFLPDGNDSRIHLLRAEVPGPTKGGKLVPRLKRTAQILYTIYLAFTVIQAIALRICGLPWFDSICNSCATVGTGGFSVLNNSIAGYNNPAAEWVIITFMFLCGINFNLYYFILIGQFKDVLKDEELRVYLILCLTSTALISVNIWSQFPAAGDCIRTSLFQVLTVMSTCGYGTADFNLWPTFSKTVLLLLMFSGACAGSTAGGFKISRVMIVFKNTVREIKHVLRPRSVNVVRLNGQTVPEETVRGACNYLAIYVAFALAGFFLLSLDSFPGAGFSAIETNFTAMVACLNNIGPGFAAVGPTANFAGYSIFSKLVLTVLMLVGRLEIIPFLVLFSRRRTTK